MRQVMNMKKAATCIMCLVFPSILLPAVLRLLGHKVAWDARIGFSLVLTDRIFMGAGARIGHFSIVHVRRVVLRRGAYLGHMNFFNGPFSMALASRAEIGNRNVITRARHGVSYGPASLTLGELSKVTAGHKIDCTNSVRVGDFCTLAGAGIQIWTHGYVHTNCGPERYRVDGCVRLGNNVNIGSRSIITGGVLISDGIMVGVGTTVSKNLSEPGFYVSGALRMLPEPADPETRTGMERIDDPGLIETVYRKRDAGG